MVDPKLRPLQTLRFGPVLSLLTLLVLAAVASVGMAQSAPRLTLTPDPAVAGAPLTIAIEGLPPAAEVRLVLVPNEPQGASAEQIADLTADDGGRASHRTVLEQAGQWQLRLEGAGLESTTRFDVTAPTPPQRGPTPPAAEGPPAETAQPEPDAAPRNPLVPGTPESQPSEEPIVVEVAAGALVARRGDTELWRLDFPATSGSTSVPLRAGGRLLVGHGNSLLEIDPDQGTVLSRQLLPGRVARLGDGPNGPEVEVSFDGSASQNFLLVEGRVEGPIRFGTSLELFQLLRREATVEDPAARLLQDPTNPWLYLAVGLAEPPGSDRQTLLRQAVERGGSFYDLAQMARELYGSGERALAETAMAASLADFAARDYTPELLTDLDLHEAYGFPLEPMRRALDREDLEAADFWAPWLQDLASPTVPETQQVLLDYSRLLRQEGRTQEAAVVREYVDGLRQVNVATGLDRSVNALAGIGWPAAAAVLASFFILHLTLLAKYWTPQTFFLSRRRPGGKPTLAGRLLAIRYYSFTEKLVLVLLLAATLALIGLAAWHEGGAEQPPVVASGTLASAPAREYLAAAAITGEHAAFLRGYAAQSAGQFEDARGFYRQSLDFAPSLNNLGALESDERLYQQALDLAPGLRAARYNLGLITNPSRFQQRYLPTRPLLIAPTPTDLQIAMAGHWEGALTGAFANPWKALLEARPNWLPPLGWQLLVVLFLLLAAFTIFWVVVPRPRLVRNAPRTWLYHLLVLLVPGTGLADELWGVLLLLPWAVFGLDALAQLVGWGFGLGFSLDVDYGVLATLYLVNLIAFAVEFGSYRRRMQLLKRNDPDTARAFGLRVEGG